MFSGKRFRFGSFFLSAFFVITAIVFCALIGIVWTTSIQTQKVANLQHDVNLIMNGITGSILGSAELDSEGLTYQSKSLMQEYLDYTFGYEQLAEKIHNNIVRVDVYVLDPYRKSIGYWVGSKDPPSQCLETRTEFFHPQKTPHPYVISLKMNTCVETRLNVLEFTSVTAPVLISILLIIVWGICIYLMLRSVSYATKILGKTAHVEDIVDKTHKISWKDVSRLTEKAVQVRGRNLQYYQTLILDAQHDAAKLLDAMTRKQNEKELHHKISMLRSVLQALALEVSTSHAYTDITTNRELSRDDFLGMLDTYFKGADKNIDFPFDFTMKIKDLFVFERILVNLASNAFRHGHHIPRLQSFLRGEELNFILETHLNHFDALKFYLARKTGRIDTKNENTPVYSKLWGRQGRGLSIIKRGLIRLQGTMLFEAEGHKITTGFQLPVDIKREHTEDKPKSQYKRRVIFFDNEVLLEESKKLGLESFLTNEKGILSLIEQGFSLEIVCNKDLFFGDNYPVKIITKKERLRGLASNWLAKDVKEGPKNNE